MIRSMDEAPRDGSHFLALERVGIEDTDRHVLEWREIWYEPSRAFFGPTMWRSVAGAARTVSQAGYHFRTNTALSRGAGNG